MCTEIQKKPEPVCLNLNWLLGKTMLVINPWRVGIIPVLFVAICLVPGIIHGFKKKGIQVMKYKKIRMQKVSRKQRHWFELSSQSMPRRGKFPKHTHPCVWSHAIPSSSRTRTPCFFFLSTKCIQYFNPPLVFSPSYFPWSWSQKRYPTSSNSNAILF